jgi:hypothetical protein
MYRLKTSEGTPKPDTWPMCRGPFAYGQATAVKTLLIPESLSGPASAFPAAYGRRRRIDRAGFVPTRPVWQLAPAGPAVSNGLVTAQDADRQPAPPVAPEPPQPAAADQPAAEPPAEPSPALPAEPAAKGAAASAGGLAGAEDLIDPAADWPDRAMADLAAARAQLDRIAADRAAARTGPDRAPADHAAARSGPDQIPADRAAARAQPGRAAADRATHAGADPAMPNRSAVDEAGIRGTVATTYADDGDAAVLRGDVAPGSAAEATGAAAEPSGAVEADEAPASNFPLWPTDTAGTRSAKPAAPARPQLPRRPRRPAVGIPLLVVFALLAALFAWLGAEPAWLAAGHSDQGTVRITWCTGAGWSRHCVGDFVADGHRYSARHVTVFGAPVKAHTSHEARMVSRTAGKAYLGDRAGLTLRWAVPLALVLLCGLLIALTTGAWRLPGRGRAAAVSISLLAPLVIAAGILAAAW